MARSRPDTAAAAVAARPASWIVSPGWDLLLFVGTPALILPAVLGMWRLVSAETLYLLVGAFGALGHHLPGMMRAYGDRALFERFRTRFIVAPLLIGGACVAFSFTDLTVLVLVTFVWGVWHGFMQTHGFLRIYDAKWRSIGRTTATLDMWMCLSWFAAGVAFSPTRMHYLVEKLYSGGGPILPATLVHWAKVGAGALVAVVTALFVANAVRSWRAGLPPSPVKLLLLGSSIAFWWYANIGTGHLLIGLVMFEIFHDVQYLSIVWLFNRRRVEQDPGVGAFTRFVFRNSGALIGLYVGLVFAYGGLRFVPDLLASEALKKSLLALLTGSALLHFYYDGFIWKMREKPMSATLGLEGGRDVGSRGTRLPAWAPHSLKWAALLVPVVALTAFQARSELAPNEIVRAMAAVLPDDPLVRHNMAIEHFRAGHLEDAIRSAREALLSGLPEELRPQCRRNLAVSVARLADRQARAGQAETAVALVRETMEVHPGLPDDLAASAQEALGRGEAGVAAAMARVALLARPEHAPAAAVLARAEGR